MEYVTLNNGVKMPILGYGVYQTPPEDTARCVLEAIRTGYRSIDTAQAYGNEEGVGNAIEKCGLEMPSKNADFQEKTFSSLQKYGSQMPDTKKPKLSSKNL